MLSQMAHSPVNMGQTPPAMTSHIVAPTPVSGMVPIRNPLYDQAGLTSSVLLQPLNEVCVENLNYLLVLGKLNIHLNYKY